MRGGVDTKMVPRGSKRPPPRYQQGSHESPSSHEKRFLTAYGWEIAKNLNIDYLFNENEMSGHSKFVKILL